MDNKKLKPVGNVDNKNIGAYTMFFLYSSFLTCLSFVSGEGSQIPYSKTYLVTGLCSELTLNGALNELLHFQTRIMRNPAAADDSAIPTALKSNLFSHQNDIFPKFRSCLVTHPVRIFSRWGLGTRL